MSKRLPLRGESMAPHLAGVLLLTGTVEAIPIPVRQGRYHGAMNFLAQLVLHCWLFYPTEWVGTSLYHKQQNPVQDGILESTAF